MIFPKERYIMNMLLLLTGMYDKEDLLYYIQMFFVA
jgi:hypothetical protein